MGRPSIEITDTVLKNAEELASKGLTQEQVAYCLGMGRSTFFEKLRKNPDFMDAIKKGRAAGVHQVANRLFEKAMDGDTTSMIFFLKSRGGWSDRPEPEEANEGPKIVGIAGLDLESI